MVSIWTPFIEPQIYRRCFAWPNLLLLSPVPVITLALFVWLLRSLQLKRDVAPFLAALGLFGMCYLGLGISIVPMIVPYTTTLWAGRLIREVAGVLGHRHAVPADHRHVYGLVVLGIPRESEGGRRIPLAREPVSRAPAAVKRCAGIVREASRRMRPTCGVSFAMSVQGSPARARGEGPCDEATRGIARGEGSICRPTRW
jgi:hypothetical protein